VKICITAASAYVDGKVSELFGRCKNFIFIDPETGELEILPNTTACFSNAGVRAAVKVIEHKPSAIVTGRIGKNASAALRKAGVEVLLIGNATVREALELYRSGKLEKV
jgi:predicted Fe-Mo cluster-binding NifX family protein